MGVRLPQLNQMFRPITIALTLLAFLFHTLGVPVTFHACRMEREAAARGEVDGTACSACRVSAKPATQHSDQKSFRSLPCCSYKTITPDKVDSALPKVPLLELPAVQLFPPVADALLPDPLASLYRHAADLPPPADGMIALARTAYLRNATLLI